MMDDDPLRAEAERDIRDILYALAAAFSLAELERMISSRDLAPLVRRIDAAYEAVAEVSLALFLADLARAGRMVDGSLSIDTTTWRVMQGQAQVRAALSRTLAKAQRDLAWKVAFGDSTATAALAALWVQRSLGLTEPQLDRVKQYGSILAVPRTEKDRASITWDQFRVMTETRAAQVRRERASVLGLAEAQRARGRADREAWEQAGDKKLVDLTRVWRQWECMFHNSRDSHTAMHEQRRGFHEPFVSGLGNLLMYPGDGAAPPQDVANCQCDVKYVRG